MGTYSVKEIADMLNTNPETVRRWIRSGKLEAIQESRKEGNIITDAMLDSFLKSSPKYAGIVAGLLTLPIGITTSTAIILKSILSQNATKNEHSQINSEEIIRLLKSNIQSSENAIKKKNAALKQLKIEIEVEKQNICEAKKIIKQLES